jgi:hypothetical protein
MRHRRIAVVGEVISRSSRGRTHIRNRRKPCAGIRRIGANIKSYAEYPHSS